jgi:cellulose biosynthesis protein BcsQ
MFSELHYNVLVADLDPQANLTAMFLDEDRLAQLWTQPPIRQSVLAPMLPLLEGEGGIAYPHVEDIDGIGLLVGDLGLSNFEDELSQQWPRCLDRDKRAFRVIGAFHEVIQRAAAQREANMVLIDVGPNLGAINRSALIASQQVVVPVAPDLFSIQGLQNLGPRLRQWRQGWTERIGKAPPELRIPPGTMNPIGYVVMQHAVRLDRPIKAYNYWMEQIPKTYRESVLGEHVEGKPAYPSVATDPHCLALVKHYRSLMPMAMEARKPMFLLKPADGAIGAHSTAVANAYGCFQRLAQRILEPNPQQGNANEQSSRSGQ